MCKPFGADIIALRGGYVAKVGAVIKARREALGISRAEMARQTGLPLRTLQDWELGVNNLNVVYSMLKVARVLGCTIEDLIDLDDAEK